MAEVRPANVTARSKLPVLVWIYGGGFTAGGSADPRYNTSFIVRESVRMGKPIMAISINYRVGAWGFLASKEIRDAKASNIGLYDQRLALRWIHENVAGFGGDPDAVTISGESAGAFSVGYHLVGFGGNHDNLFRAAILQSGSALGPALNSIDHLQGSYQPIYDNITKVVGCNTSKDSLACLRSVPFEKLSRAFEPFVLTPVLDGDFLDKLPSQSYAKGEVADVAMLIGANTDEGTATFFGPRGTLNNETDVATYVSSLGRGLDSKETKTIMALYPDDPRQGCPFNTGNQRFAHQNGQQYKRGAAIAGDSAIIAGRRASAQYHALSKSTYSYRFDQPPWNGIEVLVATEPPVYSTHYAEICFVFNLDPELSRNNSNWIGPYKSYHHLAAQISNAWISFVHELDPNHDGSHLPQWPAYSTASPTNMVFTASGSHIEPDDWRAPQLAYWTEIWRALKT
nr:related to carboxylesterase/lipase EstA precursor [Melanopsichium pennsylvanicum 4]